MSLLISENYLLTRLEYDYAALAEVSHWLASQFKSGDIVGLIGDMGLGKTTLISAIADNYGLKEGYQVQSPTYSLVHEYQTNAGMQLSHADLYRIEDVDAFDSLELTNGVINKIVFIEWIDRLAQDLWLQVCSFLLSFELHPSGSRILSIYSKINKIDHSTLEALKMAKVLK